MRYSTIFALFSLTAVTQATALEVRNANHVSKYTSDACKFDAGAIGSVMFWVLGGCDFLDGLEEIKAGIDDIILTAIELIV
ncbi:hypothetical protein LSUB1_G006740 [Lachnellula subtilissima]|uniref:Uncharacterized protein n=1 Tax=Lachnellula subtilissima TaxID=602034 RepID=A0A8H8U7Z7_9HELO|nr:hypothetical protein LSUB1_G006740 [Lachnellula subtilissima]